MDRKLRVVNVIEEARLGGPQVRMVRVAQAMASDVDTLIVMPRADAGAFAALCDAAGVAYRQTPLSRITRHWALALRYGLTLPWEVARLARLIRGERADLVHVSGGSWQIKGVLAARLAGVPSVWHLNDTYSPAVLRRIYRAVAPLATGFIFASARSEAYSGAPAKGRPSAVVPSTVDPSAFDPDASYPGEDDLLARLAGRPVIGTVANVSPVKGLDGLLRAAARLLPDHPGLQVVVLGKVFPSQRDHFVQLQGLAADLGIAESVIWTGARADVRPLLKRMDVYVCSSVSESSPVSVWEAMAMARPVVSTDVGDVPLHVIDGETGRVVPAGAWEALAARTHELLADEGTRRRLGCSARAAAAATFAPQEIARRTVDIYRRTLAAASEPGDAG